MKPRILFLTALLALGFAAASLGAMPAPAASTGVGPGAKHEDRCETNQQACKDAAARFDTWCSANAEKCMSLKAWAEKRIEYCQSHGQKCAEHREKMQERMESKCSQDPNKPHCHAMRAEPQPGDDQSDDQVPPPPPSA